MEIQNSAMEAASMNALLDCLQSDVNVAVGGWTYIGFLNWADLGGALDETILSSIVTASPSLTELHLKSMTQLTDSQGAQLMNFCSNLISMGSTLEKLVIQDVNPLGTYWTG